MLKSTDISSICDVLDILSQTKWRVNRRVLEMIEFVWSIGGNCAGIPKRYNERQITPEMLKAASFKDRMKLLR